MGQFRPPEAEGRALGTRRRWRWSGGRPPRTRPGYPLQPLSSDVRGRMERWATSVSRKLLGQELCLPSGRRPGPPNPSAPPPPTSSPPWIRKDLKGSSVSEEPKGAAPLSFCPKQALLLCHFPEVSYQDRGVFCLRSWCPSGTTLSASLVTFTHSRGA